MSGSVMFSKAESSNNYAEIIRFLGSNVVYKINANT